ncbi:MAG: hypothetical protein Kilf2KO_31920 [Rhodospirillales bacterium]
MPLARLSIPTALPLEKARRLADTVHDALVATCGVPPKDRFQLIQRFEAPEMILDPTFPDVTRTPEASVVEILFLEGRSVAQKTALFRQIAAAAMAAGFAGDDIMIALTENAPTDWSLGYGRSYGKGHESVVGLADAGSGKDALIQPFARKRPQNRSSTSIELCGAPRMFTKASSRT